MTHRDNVGRVAQLFGLTSRPELNDSYVVLESYLPGKNQFTAKTLHAPNVVTEEITLQVQLSNLRFSVIDTIMSRYPIAPTLPGNFFRNKFHKDGTILDFSNVQRETHIMDKTLEEVFEGDIRSTFYKSCLILGVKSSPAHFQDRTIIIPDDPKGPMEFRYCNFTGLVHCAQGNILFRNCRIGGVYGYAVGETAPAHVVFENCEFENNGTSLVVKANSRVTLLNCSFHKCKAAVDLAEGASALIAHCTFVNTANCIAMQSRGNDVEVVNCSFDGAISGVITRNGGNVRITGCRFRNGTCNSISADGPKDTAIHIEDCVVTDCKMGIFVSVGKVQLTMVNTEVTRCHFYGGCMSDGLLESSATITNCRIVGNERSDLLDISDEGYSVVIDGVPRKFDHHDYIMRRMRAGPIFRDMERWIKETHGDYRISLKRLRKIKTTGMPSVLCENCSVYEPQGVKFKACGKCKNVVYCCRECQVANWGKHKKACGIIQCG